MMANERKRVYAWEFPVRLTHWINVLCIIALSITGFYIGNP
ncbi:MAG TPA: Ni/Fe-hydrogenase, b-type cytochrome subunit, partial [Nitrospirae bacterium]|nr:Ni/Fe-hydrogenase, b-type cytochrome subunit [Nitrospirota bacterium]